MLEDEQLGYSVSSEAILSDEFYRARKKELKKRVSKKRFKHSLGVSDTACDLAKLYGVDESSARLAGLLHDWDKDYTDEEITLHAECLGVQADSYTLETMPLLLHGPTAAAWLAGAYPAMPRDIIQSIELHTTGAVDMTPLDMIIYIADTIEPGRRYEGLNRVRNLAGKVELEELFLTTLQHVLLTLVGRRRRVYSRTLEVWNHYIVRYREAAGKL